jgi:mannose-1-phosphate guanylyltransferase
LLAQAIERGQRCGAEHVFIVTNESHQYLTQALVSELSDPPLLDYLLEPEGRNTGPAIALACLAAEMKHGREATLLVLPADHLIPDTGAFVANALQAAHWAQGGRLMVFGVQPTAPETGFGYLEVARACNDVQEVLKFVEKPGRATAEAYLQTGRYFWNSGMFCFTAGTMLDALAEHAPQVLSAAERTMASAQTRVDEVNGGRLQTVFRFNGHDFARQPDISIDYAVMERARNVSLVPAKFAWSDVGAWPAVAEALTPDSQGNTWVADERIDWVDINTSNTHVHVESHGHKRVVATIGLNNLVIAHTPDALLVADKAQAQEVKKVVEALKQRHMDSPQYQSTVQPASVARPWGAYTTLKEEPGYKVKRISVAPGQSLSLQYHHQRAEHWTVVRGSGVVQIGDETCSVSVGDHRHIPVKAQHRLINTGHEELVLIEVQIGDYLGEDDIVRLQDVYGRA